ncbi:hypothetical protein BV20DRAFT_742670 [Pilatotrama ljubarskyi]|nr:hypothetical protein BV20DRAFT_742670 [Pilatotrama ljubarskyi]
MFCKRALFALAAISTVFGAPAPAPQVTDIDVLQFALTLEHLEDAFYAAALSKFDAKSFADAGFPDWVRNRFVQIGEHESGHVAFLNAALGAQATKACEYNFPFDSPASFIALSQALESVGDSAYIGAAQLVTDKSVLTDAASILSVEARHTAWVSSSVQKLQAWSGPFDIPLTPSGAFSLASLFIKSCPSTNPALPVKTFPPVTISDAAPAHGSPVALTFTKPQGTQLAGAQVAWLSGLGAVFSDLNADGKTTVPPGLNGTVFAAVVSDKNVPTDSNMITGFTIVQFPFDSHVS